MINKLSSGAPLAAGRGEGEEGGGGDRDPEVGGENTRFGVSPLTWLAGKRDRGPEVGGENKRLGVSPPTGPAEGRDRDPWAGGGENGSLEEGSSTGLPEGLPCRILELQKSIFEFGFIGNERGIGPHLR